MDRDRMLEERIAHLMRAVEDVSDIVARQAREIEALTHRVGLLMQRSAAPEEGATFTDERPPHW